MNQNTLSAFDEMLALSKFNDILSSLNITEAIQILFDRINNTFKLSCLIRTNTVSPKNPSIRHGFHVSSVEILRKAYTIVHLLGNI